MTGELTLTGRVLPIGGLKEKILGAVRAGIDEIILPMDNEADLDDLKEEVRKSLTIHLVEDLDQVIKIALRGEKRKVNKARGKSRSKETPSQSPPAP
jgi:ATP-dependent Lon protease